MQLTFEKNFINQNEKLKRINLLTQKLKRTHRQLTSKTIRKVHVNGYISPSDVARQNADTSPLSNSNYTDLYKKCFIEPIKTGRRVSTVWRLMVYILSDFFYIRRFNL